MLSDDLLNESAQEQSVAMSDAPAAQPQQQSRNATRRRTNMPLNLAREELEQQVDQRAQQIGTAFSSFLQQFRLPENEHVFPYLEQIKHMREHAITTLYLDFNHLWSWNQETAYQIRDEFYRLEPHLRLVLQQLVSIYDPDYLEKDRNYAGESVQGKEFYLSIFNFDHLLMMRQMRATDVGKLCSIKGTITRSSEVRPELLFGSFKCADCGQYVNDVEQQFKYTEPSTCQNTLCNNRSDFILDPEQSKFVDWQKIRMQEAGDEVPSGAMPRSVDVILRNEMVERGKAGDKVVITGMPIVVPDVGQLFGVNAESRREIYGRGRDGFGSDGITGLKALGIRDLTYRIAFLALFIKPQVERDTLSALRELERESEEGFINPSDVLSSFTPQETERFQRMRRNPQIARHLVHAIAPHIFGHEDIKRGILLQLLGGVHKSTKEGINLRGDINICIVGDPSTAKSQFLKYVSGFMPRAVYTSGKASSAAGLTASVMKDEETGEFTIEAGALMLADNGICCIDEFDKMNLVDQVAIHEAMEQQTISIAKAGIQATLNARTSILAAANPVRGRYDKKLSLRQNINMSPPIMSRFDLFFVVLDECDENTDYAIATHIVNFHRFTGLDENETGEIAERETPVIEQTDLSNYLRYARALRPKLTAAAREYLVERYQAFRREDSSGIDRSAYRITVRQLESMVRLAEALAKLHLVKEITVKHVTEACKLLRTSIVTIDQDRVDLEEEDEPELGEDADQDMDASAPVADSMILQDSAPSGTQQDATQQSNAPVSNSKVTIDASTYNRMTRQIIEKIQQEESRNDSKGVPRSELLEWWCELNEAELESQADLERENKLFIKVVKRMVKNDKTLQELVNFEQLPDLDENGFPVGVGAGDDPVLSVNPAFFAMD